MKIRCHRARRRYAAAIIASFEHGFIFFKTQKTASTTGAQERIEQSRCAPEFDLFGWER